MERAARQYERVKMGDSHALRILEDAARELAGIADAVRRALAFEAGEPVHISYSGGIFQAGALVLDPLRRELVARSAAYELRTPVLPPHLGAAIYAAKLAREPLSPSGIARLANA